MVFFFVLSQNSLLKTDNFPLHLSHSIQSDRIGVHHLVAQASLPVRSPNSSLICHSRRLVVGSGLEP